MSNCRSMSIIQKIKQDDVIKTINKTSDSLGFKNEVERKIFHSRYNYTRHASEYLKNISRKLTGEIKITNYYFENNNFL